MRAALLKNSRAIRQSPLELSDMALPERKEEEVLLRVKACGVCRTDLHIVEGELPQQKRPVVPGHQIVGEVVEGASAELPVGTRVGVSWLGGVDGFCPLCQRG